MASPLLTIPSSRQEVLSPNPSTSRAASLAGIPPRPSARWMRFLKKKRLFPQPAWAGFRREKEQNNVITTYQKMKKYKVGYTTGVYDMFHVGHLNILKRAKEQCDFLIVGVSTDENVQHYKHKTPIIPFEQRKEIVAAIRYVDQVVPQENMDKFAAWEKYHFDAIFHGDDWKGSSMYDEIEKKLAAVGCEMVFLPHTDGVSSTMLAEKALKK